MCVFLDRAVRAPQVRRVERKSAAKRVNIVHITHRDEVEPPITDWLREAYELPDALAARRAKPSRRAKSAAARTDDVKRRPRRKQFARSR